MILYRMFDSAGQLLYIGQSISLAERLSGHRSGSSWWPAVATIGVEHYSDRPTLLAAEQRAIQAERPLYNVAGRPTQNGQVARNALCRARRLAQTY